MVRSLIFACILACLAGCSSSSDAPAPREPEEVTVDAFNVALAGAFVPYEAERRQPIADAIAAHDADILCLQEVWTQADKELIRDTAATTYPNTAFFETNLDTPVDDPTDQQGEIPPAPTTVPCPDAEATNGMNILTQMNDGIDCVRDFCSTIPGSDEGRTTSTECATENCALEVAGLLLGDAEQQRCYACVAVQLPTATFGEIRNGCATVVNQDLGFDGQNGVMILSRHPLKNVAQWVIPGTWFRRTILSATAELPNGAELDVHCNHLTPIFSVPQGEINTFPYTGQYGNGMTGPAAWQAEQELQAEKLINYVSTTSGDRPAVVLGDFNAGLEFPEQDIVAEGEPTYNALAAAYTPAYTADYTPLCTFCTTNPVTDTTASVWIDHIFLNALSEDTIVSTARIFDEDVVEVQGEQGPMTVPLSDHFGMRSVVTVP